MKKSGKVIWKYSLPLGGWGLAPSVRHNVDMPNVSCILTLQMQGDVPTLWAMVDPSFPVRTRTFEWVGTGQEVPYGGTYVGTIQVQGGKFVFHLYELAGS